jgi:hypothetical protein
LSLKVTASNIRRDIAAEQTAPCPDLWRGDVPTTPERVEAWAAAISCLGSLGAPWTLVTHDGADLASVQKFRDAEAVVEVAAV